jgi:hypothetical protein
MPTNMRSFSPSPSLLEHVLHVPVLRWLTFTRVALPVSWPQHHLWMTNNAKALLVLLPSAPATNVVLVRHTCALPSSAPPPVGSLRQFCGSQHVNSVPPASLLLR